MAHTCILGHIVPVPTIIVPKFRITGTTLCGAVAIVMVRAGVHAPTKSVSVPALISLLPPIQPRSGVHTYRQNRFRRLHGGQFRE